MIEQTAFAVLKDIEKNRIHRMYLLFGKEGSYIKYQIVKKIKGKFLDEATEAFDFVELTGKDVTLHDVSDMLSSTPFGKGKVVFLKGIDEIPNEEAREIYSIIVPSFSVLIITSRLQRKPVVIEKDSVIVLKYSITIELTKKWIKDRCRENGKEVSTDAVRELINRVDGDFFLLLSEIRKLALFTEDQKKIEQSDVEEVVGYASGVKIFDLIDAIVARKKAVALKMFEEITMGDTATSANSVLYWLLKTFSQIIFIKEFVGNGRKSTNAISAQFGIPPFLARKLLPAVEKFTLTQLTMIFHKLEEVDVKSKKGELDLSLSLRLFIQNM